MVEGKKPLKRSFLIGAIVFIMLLCVVLGVERYFRIKRMMYSRYESYIKGILQYVATDIDADDLKECIDTGVESTEYRELQVALDKIKERLEIHFIYVIVPLNTEPYDNIRNVIAGATQYEYTYEADELVKLNSMTGSSYSSETAKQYLDAYKKGELCFFEEKSEWGHDYTGLLPLIDSNGQQVAALCVDVDVAEIHSEIRKNIIEDTLLILASGLCFTVLYLLWIRRNVTGPLEQLEAGVVEYASNCRDQKDPEALQMAVPEIHTGNEVEMLAKAVAEMSEGMQEYVKGMVTAENAMRSVERIAELKEAISSLLMHMPCITFSKDAQTGVYLACNQAFAEFAHKQTTEEVIGLTDTQLFDSATSEKLAEGDKTAMSMEEPFHFIEEVQDAGGQLRQLRTTKLKFIDSTGTQPWHDLLAYRAEGRISLIPAKRKSICMCIRRIGMLS